MYIVNL